MPLMETLKQPKVTNVKWQHFFQFFSVSSEKEKCSRGLSSASQKVKEP